MSFSLLSILLLSCSQLEIHENITWQLIEEQRISINIDPQLSEHLRTEGCSDI